MTINATSLERAVRRHWFRTPADDGLTFPKLSPEAQCAIVREAIEIEAELCSQEQ